MFRFLLAPVVALAAAFAVSSAFSAPAENPPPPAKRLRPNVIVLMTDDQTVESLRVMPNVRRLIGDEGATFENSFVGFALCCPSRATFLTGQYAHNHGVLGNKPPSGGHAKLDHSNTLAVWLQKAGYTTVHLGKFLNGYGTRDPREIPPGWTEWHGSVDPSTYRFRGYTLNENGDLRTYRRYQTDVYADKAVEIVKRRSAERRPYFLSVAFLAPHSGGPREPDDPAGQSTPMPAPRHRDAFAAEPLPAPPSLNEADVSDKPQGVRNRPLLPDERLAAVRENYRQRLESLLAVDEAIARILAAAREAGELDDTLVIFTSDNGFFHGEHRIPSGKVLVYEPSIRVPLLVRGPGIPRGLRVSQLVSNVDLAPTIAAAAGATPARRLDGVPLLPLVRSPSPVRSRDLLVEGAAGRSGNGFTAIRTPRYKYVEYANGERELYDLERDPYELESRHADPAYAGIRTDLARRLAKLRSCAGSSCRA